MTVVNVTRVLDQLVLRNRKVRVISLAVDQVVGRSPSDSQHHNGSVGHQGDLLPSSVLFRNIFVGRRSAYIFILIHAIGVGVVPGLILRGFDKLKHVKACN